ncbi:MAG: SGNH/GDSL hydrolase family protein [Pseudomonadota bacterium]
MLAPLWLALCWALALPANAAQQRQPFQVPDIFILGDSQFAFGAGPAFYKFFSDFAQSCGHIPKEQGLSAELDQMNVGVMGVRSTSIHSWVAHKWVRKKMVCEPDPKWMVNARLYGWPGRNNGTYVQLGKPRDFKICKPGKSAIEAMFDMDRRPKLFVMFFTGNAVHRWANAPKRTGRDVRKLVEQLPAGTPCVFMTTVPSYTKKSNQLRWRSQAGIQKAFEENGSRCAFVPGHTAMTVKTFQNNKRYFKTSKTTGRVKDPYHPTSIGANKFLELRRDALCRAVFDQVKSTRATATATQN